MIRFAGYVLVSVAVVGAMLAFLRAEHANPQASTLELVRDGVVFGSIRPDASPPQEVPEPSVANGEREALERFLDALRESETGEPSASDVDGQVRPGDRFRLTLGQTLVALVTVALVGGAMLTFGRR